MTLPRADAHATVHIGETPVASHSEKEPAAPNDKSGSRFHASRAFAGPRHRRDRYPAILRTGDAECGNATDHVAITASARARRPALGEHLPWRHSLETTAGPL